MNYVQVLPLRTILASFMNPREELPEPFLDCQAFIMGSSPILDNPSDIAVCVQVPDLRAAEMFARRSKDWEWHGSLYHNSPFVSIKLKQRDLTINLICSEDKLPLDATHMAQEVTEWANRRHQQAFTSRNDRVTLFDLMLNTCQDKPEEPAAESSNNDECSF